MGITAFRMGYSFMVLIMKIAPFYKGQRVVSVVSSPLHGLIEGHEYIVDDMKPHNCEESGWLVRVKGVSGRGNGSYCPLCLEIVSTSGLSWLSSDTFVPIEKAFTSISYKKVITIEQKVTGIN